MSAHDGQSQWSTAKAMPVNQGWSGGGSPAWGVFDSIELCIVFGNDTLYHAEYNPTLYKRVLLSELKSTI